MAWRNPLPQAEFLEPITPPPCLTGACASLYDTISSDTKYFNLAILASVPPSSSLVHEVIIKKGGGGPVIINNVLSTGSVGHRKP